MDRYSERVELTPEDMSHPARLDMKLRALGTNAALVHSAGRTMLCRKGPRYVENADA